MSYCGFSSTFGCFDGKRDEQALVLASGSVLFRMSLHLTLCGVQQISYVTCLISGCALGKAATQLFTRHSAFPIYSHLGIDTRIHTAPLTLKRSLLRLSHNIGKGQCFWRSVAHRQHAWKTAKRRALTALLPCSRQAEARHRGQWASQVEIAAYSQAYSTPVMVLSKQQGKAFVFNPPSVKHPMIFVLHEHDHFQRILHAAPHSYSMGSWSEACFTDVPLFPAPSETILPNLGSAAALWLGMCADGIYKADFHGPVSHSNPTLLAPPNAHCAKMYAAGTCKHLRASVAPPTVSTLGGRNDLAAGGPCSVGPFIPNPRPQAKPPPPNVYEAAGWTLPAWACDTYVCRGIACVHGSPGPDYHCCAMECEVPSECPTSSDEEASSCFHTPRNSNPKPCSKDGHEIDIPQLDLFRGIPGYGALTALRDRASAFSRLAATVLPVAVNLRHYSLFNRCGDHESNLWRSNADYWNEACSYSDADLANLQSKAAEAARESYVPWDEPPYDAASAYCPSFGENLPPGFMHQKQFQFLLKLICR